MASTDNARDPLDILIDDAFDKMAQKPVNGRLDPETDANSQDNGGVDNPQCSDAAGLKPFCHACQSIPVHGYCRLAGCPAVSQ